MVPGAPTLSLDALAELAARHGMHIPPEELDVYARLLESSMDAYARLDELEEPHPEPRHERPSEGHAPPPEENPCNAWTWRATIRGASEGSLHGIRLAVKENICVAGLPMSAGSPLLSGFVPDVDATVVARALDAGADILGMCACEDLCYSGGSHTGAGGPVLNPHDRSRMTGGSSSGAGALVALGEVDAALGTDQGGSIHIPAAWCGVVGLKPTFGVLPYSGIIPVEWSIDHVGILAREVETVARMLDALAGADHLDPRQDGAPDAYSPVTAELHAPAKGLRVALLQEGFGWAASDARVDTLVRDVARNVFEAEGAGVDEVSVPLHRDAPSLMNAISTEGAHATLLHRAPTGAPGPGFHMPGLADAWRRGMASADQVAPTVRLLALAGGLAHERWGGRYYGKAQNLRRSLRAQFEAAFAKCDVLAMAAVPFLPRRIPPHDAPADVVVDAAFQSHNTCSQNLTGMPSLTLPAGFVGGLPVGLMLVAPRGHEGVLMTAGAALERAGT